MPGRGEQPPALPAPPLSARGRWEQGGAQGNVQREDGSAEPFADQRECDTLWADTFLAIVQKQTVPTIIVAALMHQSPGGAVLLIGHVGDLGSGHFVCSFPQNPKNEKLAFLG